MTQVKANKLSSASLNLSLKASLTTFKIFTAFSNSFAEKNKISQFFGVNLLSNSLISASDINFKIGDFFHHSSLSSYTIYANPFAQALLAISVNSSISLLDNCFCSNFIALITPPVSTTDLNTLNSLSLNISVKSTNFIQNLKSGLSEP
jgi:hypothetical protein